MLEIHGWSGRQKANSRWPPRDTRCLQQTAPKTLGSRQTGPPPFFRAKARLRNCCVQRPCTALLETLPPAPPARPAARHHGDPRRADLPARGGAGDLADLVCVARRGGVGDLGAAAFSMARQARGAGLSRHRLRRRAPLDLLLRRGKAREHLRLPRWHGDDLAVHRLHRAPAGEAAHSPL